MRPTRVTLTRAGIQTAVGTALVMLTSLTPAAQTRPAFDRDAAQDEVAFGITMAREELWNEAIFRFERAHELDPTYAAAVNNLAVAYEVAGRMPDALEMYRHALELDPDNEHIRSNLEQFREIDDRRPRPVQDAAAVSRNRSPASVNP